MRLFCRAEIEDVELVDPRRHDQQRPLVHLSVVGAYWMSWMSSFWKTTLPGVVARLRPTSKALDVRLADAAGGRPTCSCPRRDRSCP